MIKIPKPVAKKTKNKTLFQCRIDPNLLTQVARKKKKEDLSWSEIVEFYLQIYLKG